jgi:hypothetical protein
MGGADIFCGNKALKSGHFDITCPNSEKAKIDASKAVFGVMSEHIENKVYCVNDAPDFVADR